DSLTTATLEGQFWYLCSAEASYPVKQSPTDLTFEKPPPQAVFSFTAEEITTPFKGSQGDPFHLCQLDANTNEAILY
ncbi:hypothetical protein LVK54_28140, partial [Escherichia coli]|nr:hypothetical protein [Escherichia coli]